MNKKQHEEYHSLRMITGENLPDGICAMIRKNSATTWTILINEPEWKMLFPEGWEIAIVLKNGKNGIAMVKPFPEKESSETCPT